VNVNYRIGQLYYKSFDYQLPDSLAFLEPLSGKTLYYLKYLFTFIFILVYFLLSRMAIQTFLNEKKYARWVWISYLMVIFVASITMGITFIFTDFKTAYLPTRKIIEFLESPLLCMILLPIFYFHKKQYHAKGQ
jgi:hypothetical protein